jgi:class 3 adenylate cyclase
MIRRALRSFRFTLMISILAASSLPVFCISFPLVQKIYQITREAASSELTLRAKHLAQDIEHQLDIISSRLRVLAETSDVIIASYSSLFTGLAAQYLHQFEASNPLVFSLYLVHSSSRVIESSPTSVEVLELPEALREEMQQLFQQTPEEVQGRHYFLSFHDPEFMEQSFLCLARERKQTLQRPLKTPYGLAIMVPLMKKIGEGTGVQEISGAVVAIIPIEYIMASIMTALDRERFDFISQSGASLVASREDFVAKHYLSSSANLCFPNAACYRLVISEQKTIRFAEANRTLYAVTSRLALALLILFVFAYLLARWMLLPLEEMKIRVRQYELGNYFYLGDKIFFIEFKNLADVLEKMGRKILEQFNVLKNTNQAYARFVPNDFLNHLDKKSIIDVQLGDHVKRNMSVMFSDIRNFTEMSESMTPEENFTFVNAVLNKIGPIIRENNGFIDKYIGDSIMALFPHSSDDAVKAGIAMLRVLAEYNQERHKQGLQGIKIGIGLNTGELMLGTIGEQDRMEGTVISDAVNVASRLENLTKLYGASLLISDNSFYTLSQPHNYTFRILDIVTVKGKKKALTVFEVLDGEAKESREKKIQSKAAFEEGVFLYQKNEFQEVMKIMRLILKEHPEDKAAALYIERCLQCLLPKGPAPLEGWRSGC